MNQDKEIMAMSEWTTTTNSNTLDETFPIGIPYDKQKSEFGVTKSNKYAWYMSSPPERPN